MNSVRGAEMHDAKLKKAKSTPAVLMIVDGTLLVFISTTLLKVGNPRNLD